jgi:cyclopropane fatty-acyl-phospholipid synthase-like methyltransferase
LITYDFLEFKGFYDRIVMNPPFEQRNDIKHILRAYYDCLKPSGRLVSIISAGIIHPHSSQKIVNEFQDFLSEYCVERIALDKDTFKASGTSVMTYIIVIDKDDKATGQFVLEEEL